jgi:hypothetical protein
MEPWSFEDGPEVAARIEREYGKALLGSLPLPLGHDELTPNLVNGYGCFVVLTLKAVREYHLARLSGVPSWTKEELFRRAHAMQTALEFLRRYLVAIELREICIEHPKLPHVKAVLRAEHRIEDLVERIELSPRRPGEEA